MFVSRISVVISKFNFLYRLPKMNTLDIPKLSNQDIQNEVQDFSMPSKKQQQQVNPSLSITKPTNKLDDTLSKLMKRKNCVSTQ